MLVRQPAPGAPGVFRVVAYREGTRWVAELPGIVVLPAVTRDELEPLIRDVVATVRGMEPDEVRLLVEFRARR